MATLDETLTTLADNIREKTGSTDKMTLAAMATAIAELNVDGSLAGVSEFDSGTFVLTSNTSKVNLNYSLTNSPDFIIISRLAEPYTTSDYTYNSRVVVYLKSSSYYYSYPILNNIRYYNSVGTSTLYLPVSSTTSSATGLPTATSASLYAGSYIKLTSSDTASPYSNFSRTISSYTSSSGTTTYYINSTSSVFYKGITYYWIVGCLE